MTGSRAVEIQAYIFDMDDLLVHSGDTWQAAERVLLQRLGHAWNRELAMQYKGMNALDVAATIHRILQPTLNLSECQRILRDALIERFSGPVQPMPGAVELIQRLRGRQPMAVASGSPLVAIRNALSSLGILDCFDQVITSESVARGKPHPDVFLAAAAALGTPPAGCVVLEDSLVGVQAAVAAGMRVYCVPSGPVDPIRALTPYVFASLNDVPVQTAPGLPRAGSAGA